MFADFIEVAGFVFWLIVILFMVTAGAALIAQPVMWAIKRGKLARIEIETAQATATAASKEANLVRADALNGLLPVMPEQLADLASVIMQTHLQHQVSRKLVPQSLTYSPRADYRYDNDVQSVGADLAHQLPAPPILVPTFAHVMSQNMLRPGLLLFGFDRAGEPVFNEWKSAYHLAISGKTRSGKTRSVAMLAAQMALQTGARLAILDPHGDAEGSLADLLSPLSCAMLAEPATEEKQIIDTIRLVSSIGDKRLHQKADKSQPILLLVDEMTKLLNRTTIGQELAPLIEGAAQELAKCNIFLLCSGQIWSASRTGGASALRASFASALVHRTDRDQARMLLPTDLARQVEGFRAGVAMFRDASGDFQQLNVPLIERRDIELIAQSLIGRDGTKRTVYALPQVVEGGSLSGSLGGSLSGSQNELYDSGEPGSEPGREPVMIDPITDSARMARVRQMLAEKAGFNEIIREVWGIQGKGKPWQRAHAELIEVIARIAQG